MTKPRRKPRRCVCCIVSGVVTVVFLIFISALILAFTTYKAKTKNRWFGSSLQLYNASSASLWLGSILSRFLWKNHNRVSFNFQTWGSKWVTVCLLSGTSTGKMLRRFSLFFLLSRSISLLWTRVASCKIYWMKRFCVGNKDEDPKENQVVRTSSRNTL